MFWIKALIHGRKRWNRSFFHNIIGKSGSTIFPLNMVIRSIFHILWNCSYVYVFIFERGGEKTSLLSAWYRMSSHNDIGSGCLVSLKDRVTDNRCPSYCFDQPNGCMEVIPHQNNLSAISEAWAWGISSFLSWSNTLSSYLFSTYSLWGFVGRLAIPNVLHERSKNSHSS